MRKNVCTAAPSQPSASVSSDDFNFLLHKKFTAGFQDMSLGIVLSLTSVLF